VTGLRPRTAFGRTSLGELARASGRPGRSGGRASRTDRTSALLSVGDEPARPTLAKLASLRCLGVRCSAVFAGCRLGDHAHVAARSVGSPYAGRTSRGSSGRRSHETTSPRVTRSRPRSRIVQVVAEMGERVAGRDRFDRRQSEDGPFFHGPLTCACRRTTLRDRGSDRLLRPTAATGRSSASTRSSSRRGGAYSAPHSVAAKRHMATPSITRPRTTDHARLEERGQVPAERSS
jgi:hypothetical protein